MTLETDAGIFIVAGSRQVAIPPEVNTRWLTYDSAAAAAALLAAKDRQLAVVYPLKLAHSRWRVLSAQIAAARDLATDLRTGLASVKTAALVDLDNPTAGDAAITALTTLISAIDAALVSAIRDIPNLTYEDFRDV